MPDKQKNYKIQDIAKALGVDKAEVIELLDKVFPSETPRKSATGVPADVVDYLLEVYTRKHEVSDVMAAFKTTGGLKSNEAEVRKFDTKTAKKSEPKEAASSKETSQKETASSKADAKAAKSDAKKTEEKKPAKAEEKEAVSRKEPAPSKETVKPEVKDPAVQNPDKTENKEPAAQKNETKPEVKTENKPKQDSKPAPKKDIPGDAAKQARPENP